jgi:regulator of protease activity HflC (stomatin/prohibitin superfamily)
MPYSTKTTEVGIRTKKFSIFGKAGVQDTIYQPGQTNFFVPFLNDWNTFDTAVHSLEMTMDANSGDVRARDDIMFKTIDGNDISLDIIVSYRIDPAKAPYILQNVATTDEQLQKNIVRTVARSKPRDVFGELHTEDFYTASERETKSGEARDKLNEILGPYGIIVERVGTKDYRFNPAYQQAIQEKKIADQQVEKNRSQAKAVEEEYLKKVEEAKGEVGQVKAEADGKFEQAKVAADAYYDAQKNIAAAIEAEGRADAEALTKMNEAMAGSGGDAMVRMTVAESLMGKKIVLLPIGGGGLDVRTTDVNALLELYGIKALTQSTTREEAVSTATPQPQVLESKPQVQSSSPQPGRRNPR